MKKTLLAISFSAALITGSLSSPAEASRKVCQWTCPGTKCKYKVPTVTNAADDRALQKFLKANKFMAQSVGNVFSISWRSMSLPDQRKYCSACGWGHVKKWSGNYCDKNKRKGNY